MDGEYQGAHLASITPGVKTLEMRDAEGEPLRSMRTGYFSRDFPNFADPPPDYIQHVHGHLPEDLGESIEADWPIWARETRRAWRYASPKDQRTAYPRILLTVATVVAWRRLHPRGRNGRPRRASRPMQNGSYRRRRNLNQPGLSASF